MHPLSFWSLYILSPLFLAFSLLSPFHPIAERGLCKKSGGTLQLLENKFSRKTQVVQKKKFARSFFSWKKLTYVSCGNRRSSGSRPGFPPSGPPGRRRERRRHGRRGGRKPPGRFGPQGRGQVTPGRTLERETNIFLPPSIFFNKNEFE